MKAGGGICEGKQELTSTSIVYTYVRTYSTTARGFTLLAKFIFRSKETKKKRKAKTKGARERQGQMERRGKYEEEEEEEEEEEMI